MPRLTANTSCKNIEIKRDASLSLGNYQLIVMGECKNNGVLIPQTVVICFYDNTDKDNMLCFSKGANLVRADLRGLDLKGFDLSEANLEGADLRDVDFEGANLKEASLTQADLRESNLERVDLTGVNLKKANLEGANLKETILIRADLREANLERADLTSADLKEANLEGADLTGADFNKANLEKANLLKTTIKDVNFFGANIVGARVESSYSKIAMMSQTIEEMDDAVTAYSVPKSMKLNETALVNLLILIHFNKSKKELVKILIEEKKKNGEKVSNMQLESDVLKASWKMKAIIKGNNFKIAAISEEIQAMTLNDATEWKWQIKALKEGVQSLHLSITAIFEMNGEEERKTFRTYDRTIEVIVKKKIIYFISTNWYWIVTIITTLTTIFITWFTAYLAKNKLHKYNQKKTIKSKKRIKSRKRRKL